MRGFRFIERPVPGEAAGGHIAWIGPGEGLSPHSPQIPLLRLTRRGIFISHSGAHALRVPARYELDCFVVRHVVQDQGAATLSVELEQV